MSVLCTCYLLCAVGIGLDVEPVVVLLLVGLNVLDEQHVLLLKALDPGLAVARARVRLQEW